MESVKVVSVPSSEAVPGSIRVAMLILLWIRERRGCNDQECNGR